MNEKKSGEPVEVYIDNDQSYLTWLAKHSKNGMVVNCHRVPKSTQLFCIERHVAISNQNKIQTGPLANTSRFVQPVCWS